MFAPLLDHVLHEPLDGLGPLDTGVQVQGGDVVVSIRQEQPQELEELRVLRFPDLMHGGGAARQPHLVAGGQLSGRHPTAAAGPDVVVRRVNAGDRVPGQHPTQALLDLRTIYKRRGKIDGLKIAMVGDLKKGRTVRSLSYLLGKFKDVEIDFVSPRNARMGGDVKRYLNKHGIKFLESTDLRKVAADVDVIYQTRTQTECGSKLDRKDHNIGYFIVDGMILSLMKKDAIIMHPLPRIDEITPEVDKDPRAVYLTEQIDSGLFTRMALLEMILAPKV